MTASGICRHLLTGLSPSLGLCFFLHLYLVTASHAGPVTYSGKGGVAVLRTETAASAITTLARHGFPTIIQIHADHVTALKDVPGPALFPEPLSEMIASAHSDGNALAKALEQSLASQDYTATWHPQIRLLWIKPRTAPDLRNLTGITIEQSGLHDLDKLLRALGKTIQWENLSLPGVANWPHPSPELKSGTYRLEELLSACINCREHPVSGFLLRTAVEYHPDANITRHYADLVDVP
jgi:hypothetical protein